MSTESALVSKGLPESKNIALAETEDVFPARGKAPPPPYAGQPHEAIPTGGPVRKQHGLRILFDYLDAIEMGMVRRACRWTRFRSIRKMTIAVNVLGNGWLYPLIGIALAFSNLTNTWKITVAALLTVGTAHAIYAVLKHAIGRQRPFERDSSLQSLARVLDRYSFPSGHCMTLSAVLAPIVHAAPTLFPAAVAALIILSWCRLAAAHHYPSDVLAGIGIGAAVGFPVARIFVPT